MPGALLVHVSYGYVHARVCVCVSYACRGGSNLPIPHTNQTNPPRLDAVEELMGELSPEADGARALLKRMPDLERQLARHHALGSVHRRYVSLCIFGGGGGLFGCVCGIGGGYDNGGDGGG